MKASPTSPLKAVAYWDDPAGQWMSGSLAGAHLVLTPRDKPERLLGRAISDNAANSARTTVFVGDAARDIASLIGNRGLPSGVRLMVEPTHVPRSHDPLETVVATAISLCEGQILMGDVHPTVEALLASLRFYMDSMAIINAPAPLSSDES